MRNEGPGPLKEKVCEGHRISIPHGILMFSGLTQSYTVTQRPCQISQEMEKTTAENISRSSDVLYEDLIEDPD